jgi:hypothetical protein
MEFHPITLQDRPIFEQAYRCCLHQGSESSFTNLFIWRKPLDIVWTWAGKALCVVVRNDGPVYALHPCACESEDAVAAAGMLADWFHEEGKPVLIRGVEGPLAELLIEAYPQWTMEHDQCEDDYIYSIQELIELKGRKFEAKRHHIRTFCRNTLDYYYEEMNPANALECLPVAKKWLEHQHSDDAILQAEMFAEEQALTQFTELKLSGGLIRIDGEIKAFTVGEALSEDTVVIHIEKADPQVVGLYQMINREYLMHCWSHMTFVNREEDMGIPGLRAAKLSYRPIRMVEKYRVSGD